MMTQRIVVAITGASGAIYGIRALEMACDLELETHMIVSRAAKLTISYETSYRLGDVCAKASFNYEDSDLAAIIASGSFSTQGMMVIPCSVKTLSAIANSYTDSLIPRAADVTLKEGRPLVLIFRETPLHRGHIRLMDMAACNGAVIFPPMPALYGGAQTLDEIITYTVGRALQRLGIDNEAYPRWQGLRTIRKAG